MKTYLKDFLGILFPDFCSLCKRVLYKGESYICTSCRTRLPYRSLGIPSQEDIKIRLAGRVPLLHAWSWLKFSNKSITQSLLHEIKYKECPELAVLCGELCGYELQEAGMEGFFDYLLPVPLTKKKYKKRGYNQSLAFAEGLQKVLGGLIDTALFIRLHASGSQTHQNREDRWSRIRHDFYLQKPELISGRNILLVDDIITTGATTEACYEALKNGNANSISLLTIAMTE